MAFKKWIPRPLIKPAKKMRKWVWNLTHLWAKEDVPLEEQFPWCSPDIWHRIVEFYMARPAPIIFEYGTGASTLHHLRNLLSVGGTYIGVEHHWEWYVEVVQAVLREAIRHDLRLQFDGGPVAMPPDFPVKAYDLTAHLRTETGKECTVHLKLRPPYNRTDDPDGTLEEFREYVYALQEKADVVIVDGRARKACVNYVLERGFLKPGGLLVLFEAGRGVDGWLGWPALRGTSNYQPEVQRMLALGGELLDGSGVDTWPGLKKRRTPASNAYAYPLEACFLRWPAPQNDETAR